MSLFYRPLLSLFGFLIFVVTILSSLSFAKADSPSVQMLPPTVMGSADLCPGNNQVLSYSASEYGTGLGGINCVPIRTDGDGNLSANGAVQVGMNASACTASLAGAVRFDPSTSLFEGCNGTAWQTFTASGYPINHSEIVTGSFPHTQGNGQNVACAGMTDAAGNIYLAVVDPTTGLNETGWQNTNSLILTAYVASGGYEFGSNLGFLFSCSADMKGIYGVVTNNEGSPQGLLAVQPPRGISFMAW